MDLVHKLFVLLVGTSCGGNLIDRASFWTFSATVVAFGGLWYVGRQFRMTKEIAQADFLHRFSTDFFESKSRDLVTFLEYGALTFETQKNYNQEEVAFFKVDKRILEVMKLMNKKEIEALKDQYTAYEMIDFLLGYFEDIGNYAQRRLVDTAMVYDTFGYYIEMVWKNAEIKKYIAWERKYELDMFKGFEDIYKQVIAEKEKRLKRSTKGR